MRRRMYASSAAGGTRRSRPILNDCTSPDSSSACIVHRPTWSRSAASSMVRRRAGGEAGDRSAWVDGFSGPMLDSASTLAALERRTRPTREPGLDGTDPSGRVAVVGNPGSSLGLLIAVHSGRRAAAGEPVVQRSMSVELDAWSPPLQPDPRSEWRFGAAEAEPAPPALSEPVRGGVLRIRDRGRGRRGRSLHRSTAWATRPGSGSAAEASPPGQDGGGQGVLLSGSSPHLARRVDHGPTRLTAVRDGLPGSGRHDRAVASGSIRRVRPLRPERWVEAVPP